MEAFLTTIINATGWAILHSLWQGAVIYLFLVATFYSFPKLSAKVKHDIIFGTLLFTFAIFGYTFLSICNQGNLEYVNSESLLDQSKYRLFDEQHHAAGFKPYSYFPFLAVMYFIGIMIQFIMLASGYLKLKKLKEKSIIAIPADWGVIFQMSLFQLKIKRSVKFNLSEKVNVPLVIGYFKPVILFPIALAAQLDLKQVEAILIHELAHIRRNDYLINLIKTTLETLLFFNPFVWLITKLINREREHACDDMVIKFTGTPLTYAHALLELELIKQKNMPVLSLGATGNHQHLYQRIKRITNMKTNYTNAKQQFLILSLVLATVASLAWVNPSNEKTKTVDFVKAKTLDKLSPVDGKPINVQLTSRPDTDTTKTKFYHKYTIGVNGKNIIYKSIDELPDSIRSKVVAMKEKFNSPEWKAKMAKIELNAQQMEKKFNSPEWKANIAKMELNAAAMEKKFNSPEWKKQMAKMDLNAKAMEKKFHSPEWKDQMAKMELNAKAMEKKFNSPEWKDQMAKMDLNAKAMEKKFNSPEWKDQMAKMELNAKAMEKKFNSPEWKDKMAKMELNAKAMEKKFNSPEWKDKMAKMELDSKAMEKKFNSPEWKKQMEDLKKLNESPEYNHLLDKFNNDVDKLKKTKELKD